MSEKYRQMDGLEEFRDVKTPISQMQKLKFKEVK